MNLENSKIDLLIARHAEKESRLINAENLNRMIAQRLNQAGTTSTYSLKLRMVLGIVAGITAVAACFLGAVLLTIDRNEHLELTGNSTAKVIIIESNAVADVRISKPDTAAAAQITILSGNKSKTVIAPFAQNRGHARCEVEIHDLTEEIENAGGKAAWIIISKPVDILADSEISRDDIDILNML
jgi:hypothetical protein